MRHDFERKPDTAVEYEKFSKRQTFTKDNALSERFKNLKGKIDITLIEDD